MKKIVKDKSNNGNSLKKVLSKILKILLILSVIIFPVMMNILGGIGFLLSNHENYNRVPHGIALIFSGILFIAATFLLLKNKMTWVPIALSGFATFIVVFVISLYAKMLQTYGSEIDSISVIDKMYFRHLPTIIPFVLIIVISVIYYLDAEQAEFRNSRKQAKLDELNKEAPKIIEE